MKISELILAVFPNAKPVIVAAFDAERHNLERLGVLQSNRVLAEFLGQLGEESGGFTTMEENLNYSAARLCKVWPSRFPSIQHAKPYARNPQKLANKVYGKRMGNFAPNDGWNMRGSGLIMRTGRGNMTKAAKRLGITDIVKVAELLRTDPVIAVRGAASFFATHRGWRRSTAMECAQRDDTYGATRVINGGTIGLAHRKQYVRAFLRLLNGVDALEEKDDEFLRKGDRGDEVRELQELLNSSGALTTRGGKALVVDGDFGPATFKAVKAFQKAKKLKMDGVVGPIVWKALGGS